MTAIRKRKKLDLGYHEISKVTVLKRLRSAGLYDAARAALDSQDPFTRELWYASQVIRSNDEIVGALLEGIGADLNTILAKE